MMAKFIFILEICESVIMKILSLDQASKTGFSIFDNEEIIDYGVIDFSKIKNPDIRINRIINSVDALVCKYGISTIFIEDIQKQQSVITFKFLAKLQGVLINYFINKGVDYKVIPAKTWKSYCGINGKKREEQKLNTITFVKGKYNIDVSEDIADSIGIGCYGLK